MPAINKIGILQQVLLQRAFFDDNSYIDYTFKGNTLQIKGISLLNNGFVYVGVDIFNTTVPII